MECTLRLALSTILNAKMDNNLCVLAMVCTSFVAINRGTNQRFPFAPLGVQSVPSVALGNILASRCLATELGLGRWMYLQ